MRTSPSGVKPRSLAWGEAWRLARLGGVEERMRRGLILICAAVATVPVYFAAGLPTARNYRGEAYALSFMGDAQNWPGILFVLLITTVPAMYLAMVAERVGSPARSRRLAALRSAGATRADARRVMRIEAVTWSVPGAVMGAGLASGLWWCGSHVSTVTLAAEPDDPLLAGQTWQVPLLPDAWPQARFVIVGVLLVPLLAALMSTLTLRDVGTQPGLRRRSDTTAKAWIPAVLLVGAAGCAIGIWRITELSFMSDATGRTIAGLTVLGPVLLLAALTTAAPVVTRALGRRLVGSDATRLIAGRSMIAHPMLAARASACLVLVGLSGGILSAGAGVMEAELTRRSLDSGVNITVGGTYTYEGLYYLAPFWAGQGIAVLAAALGLVGLGISVAEDVVAARSSMHRLAAGGVPRSALLRAKAIEAGLPAAVMGPLSLVAGLGIPIGWMLVAGETELIDAPWTYVSGLLVLLAVAPFAATALAARATIRADSTQSLRDA